MRLRLLPCDTCGSKGALLPKSRAHPSGESYVSAVHVREVRCARCKRVTFVSAARFNALPALSLSDLEGLGLGDVALKDLRSYGLKKREAADVFEAGFDVHELTALERG